MDTEQDYEEATENIGEVFSAIALGALLLFPLGVWHGWILSRLWAWFLVPIGAPRIGWAIGAGIVLMVHLLVRKTSQPDDDEDDDWKTVTMARAIDGAARRALFGLILLGEAAVFALFL